jgi:predicted nuclease of predicted toxin-antitoxin system
MKFLLDENIDARLIPFLSNLGHNVASVGQDYFYDMFDEDVLAMAYQEHRIFLTNDRDFGELIFHRHLPHSGVILFRLAPEDANIHLRKERLQHVLRNYSDQLHHFLVVTPKRVRVRKTMKQAAA